VLTTSREPLGLTGEALVPIPPLALPPPGAGAAQAVEYPAVRLFCDRAAAVRPGWELDDAGAADVVTIVRRLDGLPLAIELAVARLRVLPVAEVARRLSDRFRLLTGGDRLSLPRHRTLAAVVGWSWELLTGPERLLAERLAVFPGGATEETATAICADELLSAQDIGDLLIALTEKSLLQVHVGSPVRYRMLETIREYGVERLAEQRSADRSRLDQARERHADFFAGVVEAAEPVLRGHDQLGALAVLRAEDANVAAARRFLLDSGRLHDALMMTLAAAWLNMITGNTGEVGWLEQLIEAHRDVDEPCLVYAEALRAMAWLGDGLEAVVGERLRPELADLHRRLGAVPVPPFGGLAAVVAVLPMWAGLSNEAEAAVSRTGGRPDPWIRAVVHASAASRAENTGDSERVRSQIGLAEQVIGATGDRWVIAAVTRTRAQLRLVDGDPSGALEDLETALRATEELGADGDARFLRLRIAGVLSSLGRTAEARRELAGLRADGEMPWRGADEDLLVDATLIGIDWMEGDRDAALRSADDVRSRLPDDDEPPADGSATGGHVVAIALSATALVHAIDAERRPEQLDQALADLLRAYRAACRTEDMVIVAGLGPALAQSAAALGRFADAAEILGAAARLRGGDGVADPLAALLTGRLRAELGGDVLRHYRKGRELDRPRAVERMDPARLVRSPHQ
jgi:predicted ATPase